MLTNTLVKKSSTVKAVLTMADQLGLSLRQNVEFLSLNEDNRASFLTEGKYVISGDFDKDRMVLENVTVIESAAFEDSKTFDKLITQKTKKMLTNLLLDPGKGAKQFDSILEAYESRLQYTKTLKKLNEKAGKLNGITSVFSTDAFTSLSEVKPQFVEFLKANKEALLNISEVKNSVLLGGIIAQALDLPKVTVQDLNEGSVYQVSNKRFTSIYNIVCQQELIKNELLENKKYLDDIWVNSDAITTLLESVYDINDDTLATTLAAIIDENPYFALATKKQITNIFNKSLSLNENIVSSEGVRILVGKLFEMKKPVKAALLQTLNTNYGITEQTLTANPSFTDLCKTQKVLFETLYRVAPRKSVLKSVLKEMAEITDSAYGVESIDLNSWILEAFVDAGYSDVISETSLLQYMDFAKVAQDLSKIGNVLQMIQGGLGGGMANPQNPAAQGMAAQFGAQPGMDAPPMGDEMADPDGQAGLEQMGQQGGDSVGGGAMDPAQASMEAGMEAGGMDQIGGEEMPGEEGMEGEAGPEMMGQDELINQISMLDSLLADLKADLGLEDEVNMDPLADDSEEFPMGMEGGMEPDGDEMGGEGGVTVDTGDGDDDVHIDSNSHQGDQPEEEGGSDGEDADDDGDMDEPKPKSKPKEKSKPPAKKKPTKGE